MSTNVGILADKNVIKEEAELVLKYEYLTVEIQRTWNVREKVIPAITGRPEPFQKHQNST
jgi:hypothetical protein